MEVFISLATNFLILLDAMAIYILIGLFFAGLLKQFIPDDFVLKHLGNGNISSVIKATVLGIPLPVCSCSVIPLAQSLKKEGASKGAVQSFLISTPITGVDSILATFSFFGLIFTIFRVLSSIIIAIIVGLVQNMFHNTEDYKETKIESFSCCSQSFNEKKEKFSLKKALSYGYITLFKDMVKPLFIGLILGALFTTFTPKEYTSLLFDNQILTYFVVLVFAIPLYVCATASLPIAAALMLQGMSGGAAFIFLTAGPATSAITMSVVYKTLGRKSLIIYTFSIMILSLFFGFIFDCFFENIKILNISHEMEESSFFSQFSSLILLLMLSYYLVIPWIKRKNIKKHNNIKNCCSNIKLDKKNVDFSKITFKKNI